MGMGTSMMTGRLIGHARLQAIQDGLVGMARLVNAMRRPSSRLILRRPCQYFLMGFFRKMLMATMIQGFGLGNQFLYTPDLFFGQWRCSILEHDIGFAKDQMIVVSRLGIERHERSDSIDIAAKWFVDSIVMLLAMMIGRMFMKVEFEVQAAKSGHLTLDTDILGIVLNVILKEFIAASMFLVTGHVGRRISPTIDRDKEYVITVNVGHGGLYVLVRMVACSWSIVSTGLGRPMRPFDNRSPPTQHIVPRFSLGCLWRLALDLLLATEIGSHCLQRTEREAPGSRTYSFSRNTHAMLRSISSPLSGWTSDSSSPRLLLVCFTLDYRYFCSFMFGHHTSSWWHVRCTGSRNGPHQSLDRKIHTISSVRHIPMNRASASIDVYIAV